MAVKSPLVDILKTNAPALSFLKEGELTEAMFINKTNKAAFFDMGRQGIGIIYGAELVNAHGELKNLNQGDKILVKVLEVENDDGYIEVSLKETHKQQAWERMKEIKESEEAISVKIEGANSGGLIANIDKLNAFLPVSQLSGEHYPQVDEGNKSKILEELKKLVGETLKVKIIDANSHSSKLILSEKAITSDDMKEKLAKYKEGDIIDGIITGVADFGAFLKFANDPEVEGLIHISELNHRLIENPKEVVSIDDMVKAKIVEIKNGRVSLSLKALQENPWDKVEEKFKVGQEVDGEVIRFNPFGAFIGLADDLQGLIHVSEFGSVEEMKKHLEVGKIYKFTVELIKTQEKRIVLKLKKEEKKENVNIA
ncbi:MAG: S1 RNA-binding domain-containing protein [Patescibacteria group bacterium]